MMSLNAQIAETTLLSEADLAVYVINATKEVFDTMVMLAIEDSYPLKEPVTSFHCSVTGMVGLAGTYTGILSIHCPQSLALRITSNMLGMDVDEVGEDVNDALGEIANMIGGSFKHHFVKDGHEVKLSTPSVISGGEYEMTVCSLPDTLTLLFETEEESFTVSLYLETSG